MGTLWDDAKPMDSVGSASTPLGMPLEAVATDSIASGTALEMVATEVDETAPITNDPSLEVGTWSTIPPA